MVARRFFLMGGAAGAVLGVLDLQVRPARAETYPVSLTDVQWRARLTPNQYAVLRQAATETPFTSPLLNEHRAGIFGCVGCKRDLFSSKTKFDSGTGWPSFWAPINAQAVRTSTDRSLGMVRTAVSCAGCGGHLGHVFNDGPKPTGLRYCMNGIALTFRPTAV